VVLELIDVKKKYFNNEAIKGIDFTLSKNQIVGLLGPNGAGKTTTLNLISGLIWPDSGIIRYNGIDILTKESFIHNDLGYLPETPPLYPDLSIIDNLSYTLDLKKNLSKDMKNQWIVDALESLDLNNIKSKKIKYLSKGFKQRVGIAQAIVNKPNLIILDEPTVGLDPKQVLDFRNLLLKLKKNHSILISTHILSEVEAICDKIVMINQGEVIFSGTLNDALVKKKIVNKIHISTLEPIAENILMKLKSQFDLQKIESDNNNYFVNYMGNENEIYKINFYLVKEGVKVIKFENKSNHLESLFQ
jgi:ABC-2 type transport system ATP-binding protein